MMYRYFTKQRTHRFVDVLQDIVDSYNATPHRPHSHQGTPFGGLSYINSIYIKQYMYKTAHHQHI